MRNNLDKSVVEQPKIGKLRTKSEADCLPSWASCRLSPCLSGFNDLIQRVPRQKNEMFGAPHTLYYNVHTQR